MTSDSTNNQLAYARPATGSLPESTRWLRARDILAGAFLIVVGLAFEAMFCGVMGLVVVPCFVQWSLTRPWIESHEGIASAISFVLLMAVVNIAAFYDFYRRRHVNKTYGTAGRIHLVPRGFNRIKNGRDL